MLELTRLQYAILSLIPGNGDDSIKGADLRTLLAKAFRIKRSGPSFYQAMARLEEAKLATGDYQHSVIDNHPIKTRVYRITQRGVKACKDTREFYISHRYGGRVD